VKAESRATAPGDHEHPRTRQGDAEAELEARMHRWAVTVGVAGLVVLGATGLALICSSDTSERAMTGAILVTATVSGALGYLGAAAHRRRATRAMLLPRRHADPDRQ
jgi:hypothetical protein